MTRASGERYMDETVLHKAGAALAHARKTASQVPPPWPEAPASLEQAYALQRAAIAALGGGLAGWKIGATGKDHQARLKTDRPFFGPIPETDRHEANAQNGVALPFRPGTRGVECEIAFRMARALPRREAPYGRDEVKAAVGSLHPALEVVGTRVVSDGLPDVRLAIADYGLNMAFLPGAAVADWHELDLSSIAARCLVDGQEKATGTGVLVLGDPLQALVWLADNGPGLEAGQWVSSGTLTGITPVAAGSLAEGDFGALGRVSVRFMA
ncbi:hypothetical protein SH611_03890 [Geminicoccaceae bacterium 1502E]|nr:hypothetical protein [Geminicoccaceae bacterium 1502E]